MTHASDALLNRPGSILSRLLSVASVFALICTGVPVAPVTFAGSCIHVTDESRPAPSQHEAPAEDGDEEQKTKSEKESEGGSEALAAATTGPGFDGGAGRFLGVGSAVSRPHRAGHGDRTIRGPPLS